MVLCRGVVSDGSSVGTIVYMGNCIWRCMDELG